MKKRLMKVLSLILAMVMLLSMVTACGDKAGAAGDNDVADSGDGNVATGDDGSADAGTSDEPKEVTVLIGNDSGTLHPHGVNLDMNAVIRHVYDVPMDTFLDGTHDYLLVESVETVDDIHYVLHLREGVSFTNGNPFTAEDMIFSMELARDNAQFNLQVKSVDFEKTAIKDDYTIDLWLTTYDPGNFTGWNILYMFDKESYDADALATDPNGTGPYVITEYVPNSHITMEAKKDWWGGELAYDKINFLIMSEPSQRVNAIATGDADYASIPLKDVEYVEGMGGYTVELKNSGSAYVAYLNMSPDESNPLNSPEARQAIMYAIDRQAIVDVVMSGQSTLPLWPASETVLDYEERFDGTVGVYAEGYNLEKAKQLAEESGLVGKTIRIMTNGASEYVTMAELIQNDLSKIGVNVVINNYDSATYFSLLMDESNFEIGLFIFTGATCLASDLMKTYLELFTLGWEGPDRDEYMALAGEAFSASDSTVRGDKLYQLMSLIDKNAPYFILCEASGAVAYTSDIGNVVTYLDGTYRVYRWE